MRQTSSLVERGVGFPRVALCLGGSVALALGGVVLFGLPDDVMSDAPLYFPYVFLGAGLLVLTAAWLVGSRPQLGALVALASSLVGFLALGIDAQRADTSLASLAFWLPAAIPMLAAAGVAADVVRVRAASPVVGRRAVALAVAAGLLSALLSAAAVLTVMTADYDESAAYAVGVLFFASTVVAAVGLLTALVMYRRRILGSLIALVSATAYLAVMASVLFGMRQPIVVLEIGCVAISLLLGTSAAAALAHRRHSEDSGGEVAVG